MPEPIKEIAFSRYAARVLLAHPELTAELADPMPFTKADMAGALAQAADEPDLMRRLRRIRAGVLLRIMARDLSDRASLEEVCGTMSDLAEICVTSCLDWLGAPELMVVAMGKLGGRELNVSSDVDLVFVHPGGPEEAERYDRAGRALIRLLSQPTGDGFAFRVDMRLRPYGDSGPLACSFDFLDQYFVAQGREWERYAWIKARAISGSQAELDRIVRPFVFRKYLDYATLSAMRGLHAEVRREVARRELANHVKLGPGGIREIEFVAQALQLIRGGRDPELRARPTLHVLKVLSDRGMLPREAEDDLSHAYVFLRKVEHRLQYLDDAQRHDLPSDPEDRQHVAAMMGFSDWNAFSSKLEEHRAAVSRHFEAVFAESGQESEPWPEHARLAALRSSQRYALLPADSKRRLDRLVPALARAARGTADFEATLARGVDLVEAIATRAAYLALLAERPEALERIVRIIGASIWAAQYITRHPLLLDEVLDERLLTAPPDIGSFSVALQRHLKSIEGDTERQMDVLREAHQAQVFRLLAQDLAGLLTVERLADHLSALADALLAELIGLCWRQLPRRHREAPVFCIVGYGKLGGKELGYASDLDILFIYEDAHEQAQETYSRLAQRINTWLTARTSAGILFDTDLRLRPSGASGLLVSALDAFERYQENDAWVWEHQALTRARYCAGDKALGDAFEGIRERILRRKRSLEELKKEILGMREKMHAAHPNRSNLFDVKHDRGGMIDIEFAVQYLVLGYSEKHPDLTRNLGNIALLGMAAGHGLIDHDVAARCRDAYREYRRIQHALRLNGAQYARVPREQVLAHADAVAALLRQVYG
ncbi:MAG TPA: bifunctional [glutamate--ammonia ligase]-adenylyl-L-tyrosine phosphorylase/[glutamate--ammonia-ligase] adenylyltransferase [Burkholderiales bacterium]|nr:bifunctional [glutamate--ammonia ligase]-adenylyl-L-tyrosine phosphorylase/[glutamate--ammonia-ligase] adenylyltransferase [Burkholderiales bacterium]